MVDSFSLSKFENKIIMGANFCGFRRRPSPNKSSEKDSENENSCGLTASVMKCMKPRSLRAAMKVQKRQFHVQEKQELQPYKNNCKVLTLEDWFISSPGFNRTDYHTNISGGEMPAHKQSSKKIHPSFDGDLKQEFFPKSGENISVEISMRTGDESKNGHAESQSARTKSGKMKKKVSFRSPEVADIFVMDHSPEIYMRPDNE